MEKRGKRKEKKWKGFAVAEEEKRGEKVLGVGERGLKKAG